MRKTISQRLKRITNNPLLNVTVGIILVVTGLVEVWDSIEEVSIGAHHGSALFGLLHAIRYVPDLFEGAEYIKGKEITE